LPPTLVIDDDATGDVETRGLRSCDGRGLPKAERYSYVFEGNSQVLDQILVRGNLLLQSTTTWFTSIRSSSTGPPTTIRRLHGWI